MFHYISRKIGAFVFVSVHVVFVLFLFISFKAIHLKHYLKLKLCLFSEVEGIVLDNGVPVAGVELERIWDLCCDGSSNTDSTTTDERGYFYFQKVTRFFIIPNILNDLTPSIGQDIFIHYRGKKIEAWRSTKSDYATNSELGKPIRLICHVEKEPIFNDITSRPGSAVFGVCEFVDKI